LFLFKEIHHSESMVLGMKVLVLTLGFDERFAIRAMMRTGVGSGDRIVIFIVEPLEEKAYRCLQIIKEFLSKYVQDVELIVSSVDVRKFESAVSKIKSELKKAVKDADEVILNLSGGMRASILETLTAALLLRFECKVEVELEDLTGVVSFPIKLLRPIRLSRGELEILLKLLETKNWISLSDISKVYKIPKSTAHKRLRRLIEVGLVEMRRVGKRVVYRACKGASVYA